MTEHKGVITFKGNPMTLVGNAVKVGDTAPDFKVVASKDLSELKLDKYKGKTVIVVAVPSLDTPVCDLEAKKFNEEAVKLGSSVQVLIVSMDLPFAQRRWCGANHATAVETASDSKERDFGAKFGLYIKELGLLTRAVYVIDKAGKIKYAEIVKEVTAYPDYDAALAAAKSA